MGHKLANYQSKSFKDFEEALKQSNSMHGFQRMFFGNVGESGFLSTLYLTNSLSIKFPEKWEKRDFDLTHRLYQNEDLKGRVSSLATRIALIQSGVKEECVSCGLGKEWQGNPIVLQIDHINGDWTDNRKENLRFLCPNCHTQEETSSSSALVGFILKCKKEKELSSKVQQVTPELDFQ